MSSTRTSKRRCVAKKVIGVEDLKRSRTGGVSTTQALAPSATNGVIVLFAPNAGGTLPSDSLLSPVALLEEALKKVVPNVIVAVVYGIRGASGCSEKALEKYHSFANGILKQHPGTMSMNTPVICNFCKPLWQSIIEK